MRGNLPALEPQGKRAGQAVPQPQRADIVIVHSTDGCKRQLTF